MDKSQATYDAYDGVELHLLNGAVVRCAPLKVKEAVRYLRLLSETVLPAGDGQEREIDTEKLGILLDEFPARIGVADAKLDDLGVVCEGPRGELLEFGDLTLADALGLAAKLSTACIGPPSVEQATAQADLLDELPETLRFTTKGVAPGQVFAVAHRLTGAVTARVLELARDFCSRATRSPRVRAMQLRAPSQTPASTT